MDEKINNNADKQLKFLKEITNSSSNKELANALETTINTIQTWRYRGKVPDRIIEKAKKEAEKKTNEFINLDLYDLEESMAVGELTKSKEKPKLNFSEQYLIEELSLKSDSAFMTKALGDSMYPTIKDGALIIIKILEHMTGDGLYLFWINEQLMVKRIQTLPTKTIFISDNEKDYQPWELTSNELKEINFRIVGRVIWEGGKI